MGRIPEETIRQVIERSDIVEVVGRYAALRQAGRNHKALCPFHVEKTPSFTVNAEKRIFHCFGCGAGGNVIGFVMRQERMSFPEAVRWLAERYGVPIEDEASFGDRPSRRQMLFRIHESAATYFHRNLLAGREAAAARARDYLKGRGLTRQGVETFRLGYAPDRWDGLLRHLRGEGIPLSAMEEAGLVVSRSRGEGYYDRFRDRIIFPICDVTGRCVAFGGRALDPEVPAKYLNSPETPLYVKGRHVYGLHLARDAILREGRVVVVEGYLDGITAVMAGIGEVVASQGTALTVDQIRLLRRYTDNVVLVFDADPAGQAAMLRSLDDLLAEEMRVTMVVLPEGHDPDSFIREKGAEAFRRRIEEARPFLDFKLESLLLRERGDSVEGRARIAREMTASIRRIPSPLLRSEYLRQVAGRLGLSVEALEEEARTAASVRTGGGTKPPAVARSACSPLERDLIRLLVLEPRFIPRAVEEGLLDDLPEGRGREILTRLTALSREGREIGPAVLLETCGDPETAAELTRILLAEDAPVTIDGTRVFRDCRERLRRQRAARERRKLRSEMEGARREGDQARLDALLRRFNQLIKG